jgi:hypothetical protein
MSSFEHSLQIPLRRSYEELTTDHPAPIPLLRRVYDAGGQGKGNRWIERLYFNGQSRGRFNGGVQEQPDPTRGDIPHASPMPPGRRVRIVGDLVITEVANDSAPLHFHAWAGELFCAGKRL